MSTTADGARERIFKFSDSAIATPANFVTAARLLLAVPTIFLIEDRGSSWLTVSLWFVLACTDRLDGWLARRDGATRSPTSSSSSVGSSPSASVATSRGRRC